MHHQVLILKYIFNRENIEINFDSVDSFFDNGVSFPKLIYSMYHKDIPDFVENPTERRHFWDNNDHAYDILRDLNPSKLSYCMDFYSHQKKKKLLTFIFNECCFALKPEEILAKSNKILKPANIQFKNTKDMISTTFLLTLLNVLTDGRVKIVKNIDKKNYDKIMQEIFSLAKVPLIIDKKAMSKSRTDLYYIQIQIIFEVFQDKIDNMIYDKSYPFEIFEDEALFKSIQEVSKNFIKLENFDQILTNNFIPKFVMNFLNLETIPNVDLEEPGNELINIESTIDYLCFKDDFKILTLNFQNPLKKEFSTKLFFRTFFNLFFLKTSKSKMINRCVTLLSTKKNWTKENLFSEISKFDTFLYLVHFSLYGNFNLKLKKTEITDEFSLELFNKAKIPMIVNSKILKNFFFEDILPDSIFFQLQFIFDKIDSLPKNKIVEKLLFALKVIREIKLPPFKNMLLKFESHSINNILETRQIKEDKKTEDENENLNEKDDDNKDSEKDDDNKNSDDDNENKNSEKNDDNKNSDNDDNDNENKNSEKDDDNKNSDDDDFDNEYDIEESIMLKCRNQAFESWNDHYRGYDLEDGILYEDNDEEEKLEDKKRNEEIYEEKISEVLRKIHEKREKEEREKEKEEEAKEKNSKKSRKKNKKRKSKEQENNDNTEEKFKEAHPETSYGLYKILIYDEIKGKWIFDSDAFNRFVEESNIKNENIRCPIICYFPAYEEDLMQFNCMFFDEFYPFLDFEEEEDENTDEPIFVYPICDMTLTRLNEKNKLPHNPEYDTIKPIFLLVHCPKKKEKLYRMDVIMFRIYIFLSLISDLKVVLINGKKTYLKQEKSVNVITSIANSIGICQRKDEENYYNPLFTNFKEMEAEEQNRFDIDYIYNGRKLIIKKHKMVYLLHKDYYKYDEDCYKKENLEPFEHFFDHFQVAIFNLIDIYDFNSYKNFIKLINDVSLDCNSNYSELLNNLQCIEASDICNAFFKIVYDELYSEKKIFLISRIEQLIRLYKWGYKEDEEAILNRLQKDCEDNIPKFSRFYRDRISIIINDKRLNLKKDSNKIKNRLNKAKNEYLKNIKEQFGRKQVWSNEDIDNVTNGLILLLQKKYFEITNDIKNVNDHFDMFQYHYHDLLDAQNQCESDIKELFKDYFKDMEQKNSTKTKKFEDEMNQGANYSLKETENIREIEVEVDINKDLKSIIKQDF